jgi:hypothetical protein
VGLSTFTNLVANGQVAPIPVVRGTTMELPSTRIASSS